MFIDSCGDVATILPLILRYKTQPWTHLYVNGKAGIEVKEVVFTVRVSLFDL